MTDHAQASNSAEYSLLFLLYEEFVKCRQTMLDMENVILSFTEV